MAILNDLIVRGATRCLNTLYANSLQVDSQTISGNLTVNGYTYMGYSTSRSDTKLSVAGITNNQWYRSTGSVGWYNDSYGGGIYMTDPTYVKTYNNKAFYAYNGLYTGSTQQYYLNVDGKLNAADGVFSNNLNVGNSLVSRNISATNLLRAAKYDLQTITQVGSNGTLYVAPSIQFPTSNTTSVAAASTSITIIDTNITSDVMAGVVWRPSAKVKISGTINGVVTGTVDGTITSINTSSKTMVIGNLSGGNWSSVVAGTYTKDKIENLNIMMYETYQNSTYYPVGILLTSYGSVGEHTDGTAKTFIDIYGGSATKPVVRLGSMTGLDAINGVTPSGWGLYTSNGYFSGLIVSTSGKIGGWSLSTNSLTTGTWGSSGSAMLCTGSTTQKAIGGSPASTSGWVFTAGANFGVTSNGALYANSAHISGEITATSGTIGGASITGGTLLIKDANISGKISASHIDVSSITIGSLSGADNYALKDDVPTTVAELTDSGSYLTTSAASNTYATQTNFDSLREDFDNYVAPIASKEYSNIIATANNDAKGTFYFGKIKPVDYYTPWKIKYRVQVKINGITDGYETSDIIISGAKNTYYAYQTYNSITNTSYRPYYYHILYTCTQTGISNGYGHLFGISLRYSYNPTTTSNARKINVDVVETEGCTVTLEDAPFLYANAAGTGSTNYVNRYSFDATTQGYTESGDRNETNHILNNFSGKTGAKGVWGGSLFMKDGNGKYQNICLASDGTATSASSGNGARTVATTKIVNPNGFEVGGSIYYSGTSYNANTNMSSNNVYASYGAFDSRYSINSTLTANFLTPYAPIYLVGTINQTDNLFYLDSTWWTQTANNKNKVYIYIGNVYDSTTSYCRFSLAEDNTWLVYDGSKLINYQKNESDNAAKTATSYITYVNATDGIKVHNASDTTNYLQLNSSAISMYKGGTKIFNTDSNGYVTVGKVAASRRNVYITDDAVQIRNNTSVLAEYGSSIKLYKPGTTTTAVEISSTGATFTGNVIATSLSTGTKTASTTGKGTYIDGSGNIYVGNGSTNNFTVTDTGTITATGANLLTATIGNATNKISIGTGTSGHSSIQYGMTTLADTSHDGFYIGTDGIALGKGTFKVTAAGDVTATSLFIGINQVTNLQTTLEGKQAAGDYATNTDLVDAIDNIQVGGRNLIINTLTPDATAAKRPKIIGQTVDTVGRDSASVAEHGIRFTTTSESYSYIYMGFTGLTNGTGATLQGLTAGETYTFSCDFTCKIFSADTSTTTRYLRFYLYDDISGSFALDRYQNMVVLDASKKGTEQSGYFCYTFTLPVNITKFSFMIRTNVTTSGLFATGEFIELRNIKLEKGNKATDWTPAPEDVEIDIEEAKKVATNYLSTDNTGIMIADMNDGYQTPRSATGKNVFIDSDSVEIRNGQNVLSSFGNNAVILGQLGKSRLVLSPTMISGVSDIGYKNFNIISGDSTQERTITKNETFENSSSENGVFEGSITISDTFYYFHNITATVVFNYICDGQQKTTNPLTLIVDDPVEDETATAWHIGETEQFSSYNIDKEINCSVQHDGETTILYFTADAELTPKTTSVSYEMGNTATCSVVIETKVYQNTSYTFGSRVVSSEYGDNSFAIGEGLIASSNNQVAVGKFNNDDPNKNYAFMVGNGVYGEYRSNAFAVDWDGHVEAGDIDGYGLQLSENSNSEMNDFIKCDDSNDNTIFNVSKGGVVNTVGRINAPNIKLQKDSTTPTDYIQCQDENNNVKFNVSNNGDITSIGDADIGGDLSVTGDINALGNINMSGLIQYNNKPMFKIVDRAFTAIGIGSGRSYTAVRDIAVDGYKPMSIGGIKLTNSSAYNPSTNADAGWCVIPAFWLDYTTTIDHPNVQSDSIYFYIWNMHSSRDANVNFNVRIVYIATDALGNN